MTVHPFALSSVLGLVSQYQADVAHYQRRGDDSPLALIRLTSNLTATVRKLPDTAQGAASLISLGSRAGVGTAGATNSPPTLPNAKVHSMSKESNPLSPSDRKDR